MAHTTRGWTIYISDKPLDAYAFDLKCDPTTAANNTSQYNPIYTLKNFWPLHTSDLRHVHGKDNTGKTDSCVCVDPNGLLFQVGSGFQDYEGNNYTTNSLQVQRFRTRNLK